MASKQQGWVPLFDDDLTTEAAVNWSGKLIDQKDGVTTRQIEKNAHGLPLVVIGVFDKSNPADEDVPSEIIWCPATEKRDEFVFQFRVKADWERDKKHVFFETNPQIIKWIFDTDIKNNLEMISGLRRWELDRNFKQVLQEKLGFSVKEKR